MRSFNRLVHMCSETLATLVRSRGEEFDFSQIFIEVNVSLNSSLFIGFFLTLRLYHVRLKSCIFIYLFYSRWLSCAVQEQRKRVEPSLKIPLSRSTNQQNNWRETKLNSMAAILRVFISFSSVLRALNFTFSEASVKNWTDTAITVAQHTTQT